ncbi:MAG: DMT family transporter [Anaerolineae bacterium]|nr:DMT family transporter [Anaerolineae bacterium]
MVDLGMLAVVVFWGVNFPLVKGALREFDALAFAGLRFALVTVCMAALAWTREGDLRPRPGDLWKIMGLGLLGNGVYQLTFMLGLARTSASNASLMIATAPIFVALTAALLGEHIHRWAWIGIVLSFLGIALVIQGGAGAQLSAEHLVGDLIALAGAAAWGAYTALLRPFLKVYSPLKLNALTMLLGTFPLFIAAAPAMSHIPWGGISAAAWLVLLYSALFSVVVAYNIWNWAVHRVGSARTAVYSNLVPVVALLTSAILLGERMAPLQFVGAAVVITGIVLTRRR